MATNNTNPTPSAGRPAADRLVAINQTAAQWFTAQAANNPKFDAAVRERGHNPALMRRVGLGYAPDHPWRPGTRVHVTSRKVT